MNIKTKYEMKLEDKFESSIHIYFSLIYINEIYINNCSNDFTLQNMAKNQVRIYFYALVNNESWAINTCKLYKHIKG